MEVFENAAEIMWRERTIHLLAKRHGKLNAVGVLGPAQRFCKLWFRVHLPTSEKTKPGKGQVT